LKKIYQTNHELDSILGLEATRDWETDL